MTDKRIMTQADKEFLKDFRHECALGSSDKYKSYKNCKSESKRKPDSFDITGPVFLLESKYFAALHNRNKTESIFYYKEIKQLQEDILDKLMFGCNEHDGKFEIMNTDFTDRREGLSEAVRNAALQFKQSQESLKAAMLCAVKMDNIIGYWK